MTSNSVLPSLCCLIAGSLFVGSAHADDPVKRSPELRVLDHFVGTWDLKVTVTPAGQAALEMDGVSYRKWSKGGRFVVFDDPAQDDELHLPLTYDPETEKYRGVMISRGVTGIVSATWDEATKTMQFVIDYTDGNTYRGSHRFVRDGYAEASGKITSPAGEVLAEISFKQTRRKE